MVGSEVAGIGAREARIAAHPQGPQATEGWHHVERHLEVSTCRGVDAVFSNWLLK